ncbi:MAG: FKBP-type peptidyl-prolyl cis-trans isomerase [Gammaproteobacteria bacterium]|nr:FKBP-type peptidyl-prolyl cis-trans isomerase [Gammaproteobacteria bacterium]
MRTRICSTALAGALLALPAFATVALDSDDQKVSYVIGLSIGQNLQAQNIPYSEEALFAGIEHGHHGTEPLIKEDDARLVMAAFEQQNQEAKKMAGQDNLLAAEAFLAENAKKEGVVTLDSGLQYKIIKAGDGAIPTAASKVTTHYKGTLLNGTQFDSSYDRGQPATFPVRGVIPGWTEALQLMPLGSTWELYIPPALAYGERGAGGRIGPNSALIFTIELLGIE